MSTYSLANGMRECRKTKGVTAREVDEALGLPPGRSMELEKIKFNISLPMLVKLADYFGVSLDELVCRKTPALQERPPIEYCACDLGNRQWDMSTGHCLSCGLRYKDNRKKVEDKWAAYQRDVAASGHTASCALQTTMGAPCTCGRNGRTLPLKEVKEYE